LRDGFEFGVVVPITPAVLQPRYKAHDAPGLSRTRVVVADARSESREEINQLMLRGSRG